MPERTKPTYMPLLGLRARAESDCQSARTGAPMNVYWTCLTCDGLGSTDRTAEQHTKTTGHPTLTSTDPEALARMRERVGA